MRDKVLQLINLTSRGGFDASVSEKVGQLRDQFGKLFQEARLSPGVGEAFDVIEAAMHTDKGKLEDAIIAVYEQAFTEDEIDAAIAHYSTAIAHRLDEVGPKLMADIQAAEDAWLRQLFIERNVDLVRLLGEASAEVAAAPMQDLTPEAAAPAQMQDLTPEEPPSAA